MLPEVFQSFIDRSPICVMARAVLENLFRPERLDELFERTAQDQYHRTLLFSSVVELMQAVVLGVEPAVYAAYRKRRHRLGVSDQAVYDKLDGMELGLSAALVHDSAGQAEARWRPAGRRGCPAIGCESSTAITCPPPSIAPRNCGPLGRRPCPARCWRSWTRRPGWPPTCS
jgi:hypothetical protein